MRRIAISVCILTAIVGIASFCAMAPMKICYLKYALQHANHADERFRHADALFNSGEAGHHGAFEMLQSDDAECCRALIDVLIHPEKRPQACSIVSQFDRLSKTAQAEVARVLMAHHDMRLTDDQLALLLEVASHSIDSRIRLVAVQLASRTDIHAIAHVKFLLNDPDPVIRVAVLTAFGQNPEGVENDEELFPWLNDPQAPVRQTCEAVLLTRGRTCEEIALGRRLVHPETSERLLLLIDLSSPRVASPGPWLEYLSRDSVPAIRAGAARVAIERKIPLSDWVRTLAVSDPDASVRRVVSYYRARPATGIQPVGWVLP